MERQIDQVAGAAAASSLYSPAVSIPAEKFKTVLTEKLRDISSDAGSHTPVQVNSSETIVVGVTSEERPTVSHVMLNNSSFKEKSWQIILSAINKDKAYTTIPQGTEIYYNSRTGEISWSKQTQFLEPEYIASDDNTTLLEQPSTLTRDKEKIFTEPPAFYQPSRSLGRLSSSFPTVSHLLAASPDYADETWDILAQPSNTTKDFSAIPVNTEIWIQPDTREISWHQTQSYASSEILQLRAERQKTLLHGSQSLGRWQEQAEIFINASSHNIRLVDTAESKPQTTSFNDKAYATDLTEAVKSYIGIPYDKIDCYGLLVRGLKKMGLPYSGKDGLREKLTAMAKERGLPENAYYTGEGIIKAAGKKVFSQTTTAITNSTHEAVKTFEEMKHVLQKGQILSFSTPTRGHTGIISLHDDQWTFINSGRMDNNVLQGTRPKEVGEENLLNELQNWFQLAQANKESLQVTLGQIETGKIRSTLQPGFQLTQRM